MQKTQEYNLQLTIDVEMLANQSREVLFPNFIPYDKTIYPQPKIIEIQMNQVIYKKPCGREK